MNKIPDGVNPISGRKQVKRVNLYKWDREAQANQAAKQDDFGLGPDGKKKVNKESESKNGIF